MSKYCTSVRRVAGDVWRAAHRQKLLQGEGLDTKLNRCLCTADLVLIGLGHMMGAGIYVITGEVMLHKAGASTVLAYMFGGVAAILGGLCYAQFSVNIPKTGTAYNYVYFIFGEVWGFLAGWNLVLEYLILVASVGRSLSAYIDSLASGQIQNATTQIIGDIDSPVFGPVDFLAAGFIIVFFIVIAIGVRSTVNINNVMTVLNVGVILIIVGTSMAVGSVENFDAQHGGFFPMGFAGTFGATGIVFFAYVGFDAIAVASEETRNPSKSMPLAICIAIGMVTVLYCSASFALSLLVPYNEIVADTPFPNAFRRHNVTWAVYAVTVGALLGMVASLLGQAFCLPRGIYALANDGLLFSPLKYVNGWTQTPLISIAISAAIASLLAMLVKIAELVEMVSIGTLFAMTLMAGCLLKLHYLPATHCPFELCIDGIRFFPHQGKAPDESQTIADESKKKSNKGQSLMSIGQLRFDIPYLNKKDVNATTSIVIGVLMAAEVGLAAVAVRGASLIAHGNASCVFLLTFFIIVCLTCVSILLMYEHNVSFAKFQVPLVPWMPVFTILVDLSLMMVLESATWIRLIVWVFIGLIIYFAYGIRHSTADRDVYIELADPISQTPQTTPCEAPSSDSTPTEEMVARHSLDPTADTAFYEIQQS